MSSYGGSGVERGVRTSRLRYALWGVVRVLSVVLVGSDGAHSIRASGA